MLVTVCPKCGSTHIRRSQRRGFVERWLSLLLGYFPFRCDTCERRFYLRASGLKPD